MDQIQLELDQVNLTLDKPILEDIDLILKPGIHSQYGPNGAGKTMTNRIIGLLQEVTSGQVRWNETVINPYPSNRLEIIRRIGYMHQEPVFLTKSVRDNLAIPLQFRNIPQSEIENTVTSTIEQYNLNDIEDRSITKLSTGQRQRVALARTMITDPDIIILDEPTANLDMATTKWFETFITELNKQKSKIIIWTTHDQFQVQRIADTVSIIINGSIRDYGSVQEVMVDQSDPILKKYLNGELVDLG